MSSSNAPPGPPPLRRAPWLLLAPVLLLGGVLCLSLLQRQCGAPLRPPALPWAGTGGGLPPPAAALFPRTSDLAEWAADPGSLAFLAPHSRCLLDPRGARQRGAEPRRAAALAAA